MTRVSIIITSLQLHVGGPSQCTTSRKNKKCKNCDKIKIWFSMGDMIKYVGNPKEFITKLLEWISDFYQGCCVEYKIKIQNSNEFYTSAGIKKIKI